MSHLHPRPKQTGILYCQTTNKSTSCFRVPRSLPRPSLSLRKIVLPVKSTAKCTHPPIATPCGIEGLALIGIHSLRTAARLSEDPSRRLGTVSTEYQYKVRSRAALTLTSAYPSNQHKTATYKTWGSRSRSSDHTAPHLPSNWPPSPSREMLHKPTLGDRMGEKSRKRISRGYPLRKYGIDRLRHYNTQARLARICQRIGLCRDCKQCDAENHFRTRISTFSVSNHAHLLGGIDPGYSNPCMWACVIEMPSSVLVRVLTWLALQGAPADIHRTAERLFLFSKGSLT